MISTIIIDDEQNAREFLFKVINRYFPNKLVVLETCDSVQTGVEAIKKHRPELVFLDIQMPNENGFELFRHFETINFEVIFTTAHRGFAIDAIRHSALDYLLKPINYVDLHSSLKRFEDNKYRTNQKHKISKLLEYLGHETNKSKVALPMSYGYEFVNVNGILYCKSDSNYCTVICLDGREFLLAKTLKFIEELINNDMFVRIHKSYLVNINHIVKYDRSDSSVVSLVNDHKLPVSVRKRDFFLDIILRKK